MAAKIGDLNNEFLDRYQKLWDSDQTSTAFAPLAEAYRRCGNLQRALQICRQGLNLHPHFSGGWHQIAKIYRDKNEIPKAIEALYKAVQLAPENIQAFNALADLHLSLRQPKEALKAFKMVLLLSPNDERAQRTIERLESLTADEYDSETFQVDDIQFEKEDEFIMFNDSPFKKKDFHLEDTHENEESSSLTNQTPIENKSLNQTITLVDALLVRNEFLKAQKVIRRAITRFGSTTELESRLEAIHQQKEKSIEVESPEIIRPIPPRADRIRHAKIQKLKQLQLKFNESSTIDSSPSESDSKIID